MLADHCIHKINIVHILTIKVKIYILNYGTKGIGLKYVKNLILYMHFLNCFKCNTFMIILF